MAGRSTQQQDGKCRPPTDPGPPRWVLEGEIQITVPPICIRLACSCGPSEEADTSAPGVQRPVLLMTRSVAQEILAKLGSLPPEAGGALVGPRGHSIVTHFVFDANAVVTPTTYRIDHVAMNDYARRSREFGLEIKGFVHSHPDGQPSPSAGDVDYVRRAFANPTNRIERYLFPIVCGGKLHAHVFLAPPTGEGEAGRTPVHAVADLVVV